MIADPGGPMCYIGGARMVSDSARYCSVSGRSARRRQLGRALAVGAAILIAAAQPLYGQIQQALRIRPVVRSENVHVNIELQDGFTRDVRAAIHSGLKTTFTYTIDLRVDVAGWIDRTIGSSVVTSSVEYDNLERKYEVERRIDGRVDDTLLSENEDQVRQWMTNMKELRLFPTSLLERNREYYVRVTASARPSQSSMLWPFGSGTSAQAKFTFIR
jgi:hypothetical protein